MRDTFSAPNIQNTVIANFFQNTFLYPFAATQNPRQNEIPESERRSFTTNIGTSIAGIRRYKFLTTNSNVHGPMKKL